VRAEVIDAQVAELIRSIRLLENWEPIVRQMLHVQRAQVDPEFERLVRVPEPAINRAVQTLLDLRETWENTTQEERRDLVHAMIQEVVASGANLEIDQ
jgi:hypothetical protein